jgi:hypothetical protein
MKIEVISGNIKWTVESTGNIRQEDFVAVITNSKISTMKFIELYYDYYTETKSAKQAYERVEEIHEQLLGSRKYNDYDTFRICKSQFMKK